MSPLRLCPRRSWRPKPAVPYRSCGAACGDQQWVPPYKHRNIFFDWLFCECMCCSLLYLLKRTEGEHKHGIMTRTSWPTSSPRQRIPNGPPTQKKNCWVCACVAENDESLICCQFHLVQPRVGDFLTAHICGNLMNEYFYLSLTGRRMISSGTVLSWAQPRLAGTHPPPPRRWLSALRKCSRRTAWAARWCIDLSGLRIMSIQWSLSPERAAQPGTRTAAGPHARSETQITLFYCLDSEDNIWSNHGAAYWVWLGVTPLDETRGGGLLSAAIGFWCWLFALANVFHNLDCLLNLTR